MTDVEHSHHRHHHIDDSEVWKNKNLAAKKRRKLIGSILFVFLTCLAVIIMCAVVWMYTAE
jgi:heme/copper-type cytochrome/quinol oxidase subunit 4